ncbi:conserved hypothetical protein [Cupriavidus taiwanensis]|uniref:HNH domain-containing protein n=2 Tax=Cupriavidus taiwanensis TaxID=164546 RepID=A0A375I6T4_9BURK|nr:conserved hypothetical protein [Cupriavidus taiwanensis]
MVASDLTMLWRNVDPARSPEAFAATYHLSKRQAHTLQCTAEHLHARVDGGGDFESNIVTACRLCNARRHQRKDARDAINHKAHIARLMGRKRWHDPWVFEKVLHSGVGR